MSLNLEALKGQLINSRTGKVRASAPKDPQARLIFNILKGGFGSLVLAKPEELDAAKALGVELGVYSPRTGRSGFDLWLEGDTVRCEFYGMPGSGSLLGIMGPSNVECVNALTFNECAAVWLCIDKAPYASDRKAAYTEMLRILESKTDAIPRAQLTLGSLRMSLIKRASDGINAPADLYLKIAKDAKQA